MNSVANPKGLKPHLHYPNLLYMIMGVLTDEECQELIDLAEDGRFKSAKLLGRKVDGYRISDTATLPNTGINLVFRQWVSDLIGVPLENLEPTVVNRYQPGGIFKEHMDYFHKGEAYYEEHMKEAGQRTHTAVLYLNDPGRDYEGGATYFPRLNVRSVAAPGAVTVWWNCHDGKVQPQTMHTGEEVTKGTKYIAVVFARERPYKSDLYPTAGYF